MNQIIFVFHIAAGAGLSMLIGKFVDLSISGVSHLEIAEACIGATIGGFVGNKLLKEKTLRSARVKMLWINFSLWFGIAAGLVFGMMLVYLCILPLFILGFGHPETTKWSTAVANTFTVILLTLSIVFSAFLGNWFFKGSLRSTTRNKREKE